MRTARSGTARRPPGPARGDRSPGRRGRGRGRARGREPGRVAAPHLEAVEGRQRLLDRGAHLDGRPRGARVRRGRARPSAVGSRSRWTAHSASFRRSTAALASSSRSATTAPGSSSRASRAGGPVADLAHTAPSRIPTSWSRTRRATPSPLRSTASSSASSAGHGGRPPPTRSVASCEAPLDPVEALEDVRGRQQAAFAWTADEGDDAAHVKGPSGSGAPTAY